MKQHIVLRIAALLCVMLALTACGGQGKSPAEQGNTLVVLPPENEEFAAKFALAKEYKYLGLGYYRDDFGDVRDGYVPYGGDLLVEDGSLTGSAHGVTVRLSITKADNATAALTAMAADYTARKQAEDSLITVQAGAPDTADGDTVGVVRAAYAVQDGAAELHTIYAILYADVRTDGKYMLAEMEFDSAAFDNTKKYLLRELGNCYGINMPTSFG